MLYELNPDVVYAKGALNGAIYHLDSGNVFAVNSDACTILDKLVAGEDLNSRDAEYVELLISNRLYSKQYPCKPYCPPDNQARTDLEMVWLEITENCNMRCLHCYEGTRHRPNKAALTLPEWQSVIDQIAAEKVRRVVVIGGEPCTHKDITRILGYLGEKGIPTTLFTNGSLLKQDLFDTILQYGIEVKFSLYGHTPEIHDKITGKPGSHQTLAGNIKKLLACGAKVSVSVVLMKENENHLQDIRAFLNDLGVSHFKFDVIREVFLGRQSSHIPVRQEVINISRRLKPSFKIKKDRFEKLFNKNTCWYGKLVVGEDGNILPCVFSRNISLGNIRSSTLKEILHSEALAAYWGLGFSQIDNCQSCEFRFACKDCRPIAASRDGALTQQNPRCTYNPHTGVWGHAG